MKRSGFLKRYTPLKRSSKPMKRTKLRVVGISSETELKNRIQALLREFVILRDGGCILRLYPEAGMCGGYRNDGQLILQAEHLISREKSATFADLRNIVCLCRHHHGHFKPEQGNIYWAIIEKHLGARNWEWLKRCQEDRSPHKKDWKLEEVALKQQLQTLKEGLSGSFSTGKALE